MNLLILVYLTQLTWPAVYGIYYTQNATIFQPSKPVRNDSFFGYSITYDQKFQKLVISAPRENNIGEVYDCSIDSGVCTPIIKKDIQRLNSNYTHDYWFGATVKSGPDFVVMCAPRFTNYINFEKIPSYVTYGRCLSRKDGKTKLLMTLPDIKRTGKNLEDHMDSFGWSVDVAYDKSIVIGGPGMYHGRAMLLKEGKSPEALRTTMPEFNFGYSISSGNFIRNRKERDSLSYAVSSTYGRNGYGEVAFFRGAIQQSILKKKEDSDKVGTMFGAVLCAATLTGNNKTDLLVGAPTYGSTTESKYNLGAVYVYKATAKNNPPIYERKIVGQKSGAQFGSAIISLGDLNGDGKDEIAIGAPFEDSGKGVVYIYSGQDLVLKTEKPLRYLQKISPDDSYANSFGLSLTSLADYDKNGCNELAIGSPYSDTVVLFRCMASVYVTTEVAFPNLHGRTKAGRTNFEFDVCLNVTYPSLPEKVIAQLSTTVEMIHSDASLVSNGPAGFNFTTSLHEKKPQYCTKVPFTLPLEGAYHTEIICNTKTVLVDDPRNLTSFESSRVILSDRSVLSTQDSLWAAECAGQMCLPTLTVTPTVSFKYPDHTYIIGDSRYEHIEITVSNTGEVAYDMCLLVFVYDVPVFESTQHCHLEPKVSELYSELRCIPPYPLQTGDEWKTDKIKLEMNHLTNLNKNVTIKIQVFNYCSKPLTNETTVVTDLMPDPNGAVIKGETDIGMYVNMTEEDVQTNGKNLQHVYTIQNVGVTNYAVFDIQVTLQKKPYLKYDDIIMYVSLVKSQVFCAKSAEDDKELNYICQLEDLVGRNNTQAKILIPIFVLPGTIGKELEDNKQLTITSSIKLLLPDGYKYGSTESIITLQEPETPIKWIIIGVCVGLLFIIIIAGVLYKVGFLRRKKREELDKLRRNIRRQTVLRRSTMPGRPSIARSSDEDRQALEATNEEDEKEDKKPE